MGQIVEPPFDPFDSRRIPTIPQAYYLLRGGRISLAASSGWCRILETLGAKRVNREAFERADALRRGKR